MGPMPPNTFLRTFMPKPEGNRLPKGYHALFADLKIEKGFEKNFVRALLILNFILHLTYRHILQIQAVR